LPADDWPTELPVIYFQVKPDSFLLDFISICFYSIFLEETKINFIITKNTPWLRCFGYRLQQKIFAEKDYCDFASEQPNFIWIRNFYFGCGKFLLKPQIQKIANNEQENQQLSSLRDWLLPMLMNGQVKVGIVEDEFETLIAVEPKTEYKCSKSQWEN